MKKLLLMMMVSLFIIQPLVSCSSNEHEEALLGTWGYTDGNDALVLYCFRKDDSGNYNAIAMVTVGGRYSQTEFEEFSATSDEIVFRQKDGTETTTYYRIDGEWLYLDEEDDDVRYHKLPEEYDNMVGFEYQ